MKAKFFKLLVFLTILCLINTNKTQAQFKIDAEFRPRFEIRNGYRKLNLNGSVPSVLISQRTRLSFSYGTEKFKLKITPQDVRIWGDEQLASSTGVYGDYASLDIFEAYAEIKLKKTTWMTAGRQQLVYDSQRIFAARNWNQNGLSYDALVLKTIIKKWKVHIGASWNSLSESLSDNLYLEDRIKSLNFLRINRTFNDKLTFSILHTASGVTETDSTNHLFFKQTSGIYAEYKTIPLQFQGNAFYQYGKNNNGSNVNAFLIDADFALKKDKLKTGLGLSYLSGNTNTEGTTDRLFDVLYGARHRYFGHMDYFRNFNTHTKEAGLVDYYAYIKFSPKNTITISNTVSYFQKAQINELSPYNKNLGFENNFAFNYKLNNWASIQSEYVFFIPTESFKTLQGVSDTGFSQFFFLELTIKPTLYTDKDIIK